MADLSTIFKYIDYSAKWNSHLKYYLSERYNWKSDDTGGSAKLYNIHQKYINTIRDRIGDKSKSSIIDLVCKNAKILNNYTPKPTKTK
jgi:hypothetical protein